MPDGERLSEDWPARYAAWLVDALPRLREADFRGAFASYPWPVFHDAPQARLPVPVARARVALVSSGGLSLPGQAPFDAGLPEGDPSYRWIPGSGPLQRWRIDHGHYDPAAAEADYNTVLPLDVLRALAESGLVGSLADRQVSFLGYQTDAARLLREVARPVARQFREDGVDAVLLVPV